MNSVVSLSCSHLVLGQPAKVLYLLTSAPSQTLKEMDLKPVESVTSESVTATVDPADSEPTLAAHDQEKGSTEMRNVSEGSSEGDAKRSSLSGSSSSCTLDGVLDLFEETVGNSESLDVREESAVSPTGEQQPKSE